MRLENELSNTRRALQESEESKDSLERKFDNVMRRLDKVHACADRRLYLLDSCEVQVRQLRNEKFNWETENRRLKVELDEAMAKHEDAKTTFAGVIERELQRTQREKEEIEDKLHTAGNEKSILTCELTLCKKSLDDAVSGCEYDRKDKEQYKKLIEHVDKAVDMAKSMLKGYSDDSDESKSVRNKVRGIINELETQNTCILCHVTPASCELCGTSGCRLHACGECMKKPATKKVRCLSCNIRMQEDEDDSAGDEDTEEWEEWEQWEEDDVVIVD